MKSLFVMTLLLISAASASFASLKASADGLDISRKDVGCTLKSLTNSNSETLFIPRPDLSFGAGEGGTSFQGIVFESRNLPEHRLGVTVRSVRGTLMNLDLNTHAKTSVTIYESGEAKVELSCSPTGSL